MRMSSDLGGRDGADRGVGPVVAEQRPEDVDASPCQGSDGLDVLEALGTLLEVEVAVRSLADDAGLGGQVEHSSQTSAVAPRTMQVAGAASRVAWNGDQPSSRGESTGVSVGAEVAGGHDELGSEDLADAGHRGDHFGLGMLREAGSDLRLHTGGAGHRVLGAGLPGRR